MKGLAAIDTWAGAQRATEALNNALIVCETALTNTHAVLLAAARELQRARTAAENARAFTAALRVRLHEGEKE